jgi:hypothetical protein
MARSGFNAVARHDLISRTRNTPRKISRIRIVVDEQDNHTVFFHAPDYRVCDNVNVNVDPLPT